MTKELIIGGVFVALFAWTIAMQVVRKSVTPKRLVMIPLGFGIAALANDRGWVQHLGSGGTLLFFGAGVAVAVGMGLVRAATIKVWSTEAGPVSKGGWLTVVTWFATVGVRVGIAVVAAEFGASEGAGEIMLFIALTIATQNVVIARRAGLFGNKAAVEGRVERTVENAAPAMMS